MCPSFVQNLRWTEFGICKHVKRFIKFMKFTYEENIHNIVNLGLTVLDLCIVLAMF